MKTSFIICLSVALLHCVRAEDYSAFFRFEDGKRIDYSEKEPTGTVQDDTMKKEALLHVRIPEGSDDALFSITYGGGDEAALDNSWQGKVIHRGKEMIAIVCFHMTPAEKIANYVLYPARGVGFSINYSAYLGNDFFEKAAKLDGSLPFGSASVMRLIEYKK